jgi:hypothetical protein
VEQIDAKLQDSISSPNVDLNSKEIYDIQPGVHIAATASTGEKSVVILEEPAFSQIDYSKEYQKYLFPDPQSISTAEKDEWDVLVRNNSTKNSNPEETEFFERLFAAGKSSLLQLQSVSNQGELDVLENLQGDLSLEIARKKVLSSMSSKREVPSKAL